VNFLFWNIILCIPTSTIWNRFIFRNRFFILYSKMCNSKYKQFMGCKFKL